MLYLVNSLHLNFINFSCSKIYYYKTLNLTLNNKIYCRVDAAQQVLSSASVNSTVFWSNVLHNQSATGSHVTSNGKRWIQLVLRDLWSWITARYTFQDGCLTFINCWSNGSLQQRRSRDGLSRFTFDAFLARRASRSPGTRIARYSEIPFQTHRSLRSYWSMFTKRSLWPGSPRGAWFSPSSSVTFRSWTANCFIFSTDSVLQQTKLFFD